MAWAPVSGQHAHVVQGAPAGGTISATLPSAPTTGNVLLVETEKFDGTGATPAANLSGGGVTTWVEDQFGTYNDSGFRSRGSKWHGVVGASPSATVTVSTGANASQGGAISVQEYSGLTTNGSSADVDTSNVTVSTTGGTPTVTTSGTTTAANELVSGGYTDDGSNVTPTGKNGAGFTERDSTGASAVSEAYLEDKDSGASGATQTANMSSGVGTFFVMTAVVYKVAGGGGGGFTAKARRTMQPGSRVGSRSRAA